MEFIPSAAVYHSPVDQLSPFCYSRPSLLAYPFSPILLLRSSSREEIQSHSSTQNDRIYIPPQIERIGIQSHSSTHNDRIYIQPQIERKKEFNHIQSPPFAKTPSEHPPQTSSPHSSHSSRSNQSLGGTSLARTLQPHGVNPPFRISESVERAGRYRTKRSSPPRLRKGYYHDIYISGGVHGKKIDDYRQSDMTNLT